MTLLSRLLDRLTKLADLSCGVLSQVGGDMYSLAISSQMLLSCQISLLARSFCSYRVATGPKLPGPAFCLC